MPIAAGSGLPASVVERSTLAEAVDESKAEEAEEKGEAGELLERKTEWTARTDDWSGRARDGPRGKGLPQPITAR